MHVDENKNIHLLKKLFPKVYSSGDLLSVGSILLKRILAEKVFARQSHFLHLVALPCSAEKLLPFCPLFRVTRSPDPVTK